MVVYSLPLARLQRREYTSKRDGAYPRVGAKSEPRCRPSSLAAAISRLLLASRRLISRCVCRDTSQGEGVAGTGTQCQPGVGGKRDFVGRRSPRKIRAGVGVSPPTVV